MASPFEDRVDPLRKIKRLSVYNPLSIGGLSSFRITLEPIFERLSRLLEDTAVIESVVNITLQLLNN